MATPHIEAKEGEIADIVLMPGDPLRAKFIAETYLTDVTMFNTVRNMYGYTGYYNGKRVSVMGSGMGMPSIGIYSYELFKFYDVKKIVRIGTCGALVEELNLYDLILADNAYSDSLYAYIQNGYEGHLLAASSQLNNQIEETARKEGINLVRGNIYSTDVFYKETSLDPQVSEYNCLGVEMEAFALFHNARVLNKEAACLLTVSDSLITKKSTSSKERETSLTNMIDLILKSL